MTGDYPLWVYVTAAALVPWVLWVMRVVFFAADNDALPLPPLK